MLVSNPHCAMTRKALRTLEPGKQIVDDVLILLARMLAFDSTRLQWYLPTAFVIYCPMWCDNHWFLVIIDLSRKQLVYLDSLRSPTARSKSRHQIRKLAIFLDDLLDDRAWYANADIDKIECSEFDIKEPEVAQQLPERMCLAIDMVLKYHNDNRMETVEAALNYWRSFTIAPW
ncbi:hypothetical protein HN51_043997 [Arachis hypogaea]